MKTSRPAFSFLWCLVVLLLGISSTPFLLVVAQEEGAAAAAVPECDCTPHVEETKNSLQASIEDLNRKLQESIAHATGKDGEIAKLSAQLQEVTNSMNAKVTEIQGKLTASIQDSEAARKADAASKKLLEEMKASLASAKDDAKEAKQQISKYVSQRFFVNVPLLKQDLKNLMKKIGLTKDEADL